MEVLIWAGVGAASFVAAVIGGVVGIGTAIIMLPILAAAFGVREAVPIISVAVAMANLARAIANWKEIDWRVVQWWSFGALPAAVIGTLALAHAPADALTRLLGGFFLVLLAYRYMPVGQTWRMRLRGFFLVGALQSTVAALFGAAGPLGGPFYLSYGLTRAAFVGTVGAGNVVMSVARLGAQRGFDLLDLRLLLIGLAIGAIMFAGSFAGRWIVTRISEQIFVRLVELVLLGTGLLFLIKG